MAEPTVPVSSRRTLLACAGLACAGAAGAAALAGCARYNSNSGGVGGAQPAPSSSAPAAPAGSGEASRNGPPVLASTTDIPVGGGKILVGQKIVITQPKAGKFDAFTAVCTHQGCIVGTVSGGTINCPCHGSSFSISDGSVVNGPAASPLAPVSIKIQGASIVQA